SNDVLKDCRNQQPTIDSYSPNERNLNFLNDTEHYFNISSADLDSENINIEWKINDVSVWFGNSYVFRKIIGEYVLKAFVSDGENVLEQSWDISVRDMSFFSCQEVNGNLCSVNEICPGEILSTRNSICCSVACIEKPPEFEKAESCENKNSNIRIEFLDINDEKKYKVGEKINFSLRITNNLENKKNFDVSSYFYDITKDKIIEKNEDSVNLNNREREIKKLEFNVPGDLNESDIYALVAVVDDEECNKEYMIIDIARDEHKIIIDEFNFMNRIYSCGEYIDLDVGVKNIGIRDENVYIKIESVVGISEESEVFKLEKFNQADDYESKGFILKIPNELIPKEYIIKAITGFNNEEVILEKKIILSCDNENSDGSDNNEANNNQITEIRLSSQESINDNLSEATLSKIPIKSMEENFLENGFLFLLLLNGSVLVLSYI
ncbi:MAG: hypothetical protein AABX77_03350, partial [Nanoarchaeota archaeon]